MVVPSIEQAPLFLSDDIRKINNNNVTEHTASTSSSASTLSSTSLSVPTRSSFDPELTYEKRWHPRYHHENGDLKLKCPQYPARKHYLALDCEMVGVGGNAMRSSLARVVIINWRGQVLFDKHIKQSEPVTDHRTFVSGITEENLQRARMPLDFCRAKVAQILHNKILVGHGLENDLHVLGINHPWWLIRDTACYQPFMNQRFEMWTPRKLKDLVLELLGKEIQEAGKPHDPFEDAMWALNLYKSVRSDWESSVDYMMKRSVIESSIQRVYDRVGQSQNYCEEIH